MEELKQKKLERLDFLKKLLLDKQNVKEEFKKQSNIDFDILLDPKSPMFNHIYSLEEPEKENMVMAIKLKSATRQVYIGSSFVIYHAVKAVLWRYGHFATFFYRQRFLTIPLLFYGMYWNI